MLFDTHAHLEDARFEEDRAAVIARMHAEGMTFCMCVGSDMDSSAASIRLAEQEDFLYAAVGVHPHAADTYHEAEETQILQWLAHPKVKAWGEIGLDYFYDFSPRTVQRDTFVRQLEAAWSVNIPIILHIRDAHGDMLELLRARRDKLPPCLVHCYSGSWESAKSYLDMGCYLSFAGPVTFRKSIHLQEAAQKVPLDRLLIETDSPYLAPEPMRGRRNEPLFVRHTAACIATLRNMSVDALCQTTCENGMRFYRIAAQDQRH